MDASTKGMQFHRAWVLALVWTLVIAVAALPSAHAIDSQQADSGGKSAVLQKLAPRYAEIARSNIRTVRSRPALVPSPVYANGIYARDAFYAVLGLDDPTLSARLYAWFADAQNPATGQIPTAVAFDPADKSLQPQDDESTLLFVIWSLLLHRTGHDIDPAGVAAAWNFIQTHVRNGSYYSAPGSFRYWADCWTLPRPDVIAYVQGLYASAAEAAHFLGVADAGEAAAAEAAYRALYRQASGFLPLSAGGPGRSVQDVSALLPEFLHRWLFKDAMLPDAQVLATVDHHLATLSVYADGGALIGIKILGDSAGGFLAPSLFAADCAGMSSPGDYHNGGYWPMYTLVELALAYSITPDPRYRAALEQLVGAEAEEGLGVEYWQLRQGSEGYVPAIRRQYSWNALALRAMRYAGLVGD